MNKRRNERNNQGRVREILWVPFVVRRQGVTVVGGLDIAKHGRRVGIHALERVARSHDSGKQVGVSGGNSLIPKLELKQ